MVRSMTGYGRAAELIDGRDIQVEIKAVNHRYLEFSARVPRAYGYLEEKLKKFLQGQVFRGKVDVSVSIQTVEGPSAEVLLNRELLSSYVAALREAAVPLSLPDDLSLSTVARLPDIFTLQRLEAAEEEIWAGVSRVAVKALDAFVSMRELEGEKLREDLCQRLADIESWVDQVEERSPQTVAEYRQKLYARMCEVLEDSRIDEARILQEAAVYADRVAVAEETVRLRSHLEQFSSILRQEGPVGRKLDFLVQEINRETNTIGSKAMDVQIARIVVDIKAEIEKIREQIQNLE